MCLLWNRSLLPVWLQDISQVLYPTPEMLPQGRALVAVAASLHPALCVTASLEHPPLFGSTNRMHGVDTGQGRIRGAAWAVAHSVLTW